MLANSSLILFPIVNPKPTYLVVNRFNSEYILRSVVECKILFIASRSDFDIPLPVSFTINLIYWSLRYYALAFYFIFAITVIESCCYVNFRELLIKLTNI